MSETLGSLLHGFALLASPDILLYAVVGCIVGTLVGVLPGVGPLAGMSLLLPVTFGLDPTKSLILLSGIFYGAMYGGSTTSILMRIPGEAASVVTCLDGYAMARQGRAGAALAIVAFGSFFAGTAGVVALMLVAPTLGAWALKFGPPEYFAILVLGLLVLCSMSSGPILNALAMALLGLALGLVGLDRMTGFLRFDYGVPELGDGLGVVPVAVGLFGIGELLAAAGAATRPEVIEPKLRELLPTREELRRSLAPTGRGTLIGFFLGLLPGPAPIVSTFVSYGIERRLSRHPERFGQGAIEGVAGPESANNAATTSAFIPMLSLGVPTGPATAIVMAALMIHGVTPGPTLIREQPDLFWTFVASMYFGNLVLLVLNLPLVGIFVNLLRIRYAILYPFILLFCVVGIYGIGSSAVDLWIMAIAGLGGYLLRKLGFDLAPIVLGLVLAPLFELALRQSLVMSRGSYAIFVDRTLTAALLGAGLLVVLASIASQILRRRASLTAAMDA
ncbi:MAG: tripartite tricarboxylate transporter permease [candidate division NC10 bacterium]